MLKSKKSILERHRGKRFRKNFFTEHQKYKGIIFYLYDRGVTDSADAHRLIREYCAFAGIELRKKKPIRGACSEIQKNFIVFKNWICNNT